MTEEVVVPEEGKEPQSEVKEPSPVEQEALSQGWVAKEEFDGDEAKWVDAGEFLRRGELFKKIDHQNREIKAVRQALQGFKEHYTKVEEAAFNRALSALKTEYKQANREGDFDKADRLEAEIETVTKEAAAVKQSAEVAVATQIHPEFASWVGKNEWYSNQPHMKTFADIKGLEYANQGMAPSEVLKKVEAEVRKEFPNKFTNPNRALPGTVEGASNKGSSRSFELTEQETRVMKSLVRSKVLTEEQYKADIKSQRGIK